jgi:hypothetical protein
LVYTTNQLKVGSDGRFAPVVSVFAAALLIGLNRCKYNRFRLFDPIL